MAWFLISQWAAATGSAAGEGDEARVLSRPVLAAEVHRVDGDGLALFGGERVLRSLVLGVRRVRRDGPGPGAVCRRHVQLLGEHRSASASGDAPHRGDRAGHLDLAGRIAHLQARRVEDRHVRGRPGRDLAVVVHGHRRAREVERRDLVGRLLAAHRVGSRHVVVVRRRRVVAALALRVENRLDLLVPGVLGAIRDRLGEVHRRVLLGDRARTRGGEARRGARLVATDAAPVVVRHALDPELLVADGETELVDGLQVHRQVRRDVGEPAPVGIDRRLAENGCAFEHRQPEHRHALRRFARESLDDANGDRPLLEGLAERRLVELGAADHLVEARLGHVHRSDSNRERRVLNGLRVADEVRRRAGDDRQRVEVPGAAIVVDELILAALRVVDVDAEVRRGERLLVHVVHGPVGPGDEDPPVGQEARLAVTADRRGCAAARHVRRENLVGRVLFVEAGVLARRRRGVRASVDARRVGVVTRVDLHEGAGVDRSVSGGADADHHVGRDLLDREERVDGLVVLTRHGHLLRAIGVHDPELHVVDGSEMLPLREADAAVITKPGRDGVRQVLREELPVLVPTRDADGRELQRLARVLVLVGPRAHRRVHLIGHEGDGAAGQIDRIDVVPGPRGLLVDLEGAVGPRCELHRIDVVVVVRVPLHREDGLARVERHVGAVEVGLAERRGEVGHGAVRAGGRQDVQAPARHVPLVVEHLAVSAGHVDGRLTVRHGRRLALDEEQRLNADDAFAGAAARGLTAAGSKPDDGGQEAEDSQR